jgi:eukaryotic-like serine/threonine-protein kinase
MADQEWLRGDELLKDADSLTPEEQTRLLEKAGEEDATLPDSVVNPLQDDHKTGPRPTQIKFPSGAVAGSFEGLVVSHYQIGKLIGHGGMGEVYSADDMLLHRSVAVKFLLRKPSDGVAQEEALLSEARSIASVGHPSICTVYNFGEFKGRSFLVLELLEGKPLDQELKAGPLAVTDFLDLAIQTCDGLSAAHQKGTVHRDIKPSNLYICKDPRRVKILDFGLARSVTFLRESSPKRRTASLDPGTDETLSLPLLAGTVPYMSPEQIRGHGVDCRSDIFSLGTVFYQILTGSTPFEGPDPESTLARILSRDPTPPRKLRPAIPAQVEQIVMKMLQRDTELRYQSIDEVRNELATFRTELSAPERAPSHSNRWVSLAALFFLILAVSMALSKIRREPQAVLSAPRVSKVWSTDTPGQETTPSISKDGRFVVFASNRTGKWNLYRQEVGNREAVRLTADDKAEETEPALSPDGRMIAFSSRGGEEGEGVFVRNLDGTNTARIATFGHQPTWSPDAKQVAFVDEALLDPKRTVAESSALWTSTLNGDPRRIYPDARQPKWSPHGNRIAFVSVQGGHRVLQTISANGGTPESADNSQSVDWSPDWSSDGQYLYFCSDRNRSMNLWRRRIDENSGRVQEGSEPVTVQDDYIGHLSISRGTNRIAYMQDLSRTTMYRIQIKGQHLVGDPQPLPQASSHALLIAGLNPSPDGKSVAFHSDRYVENIFLADAHTGARHQLISSPWNDRVPRWSPDGQQIAFQSQRSGRWEIWLMRADGKGAHKLTSTVAAHGVVNPVWAPDCHRLAFSEQGGHVTILDLSRPQADGSFEMTALPPPRENGNVFFAKHWSPCGDFLAGSLHRHDGTALGIAIQNIGTGEITQVTSDGGEAPNWLNDCSAVVYRTANESLSIVDTHTKSTKPLPLPPGFHVFDSIGVTKDANWLFFTDLASETDVVVASLDQN